MKLTINLSELEANDYGDSLAEMIRHEILVAVKAAVKLEVDHYRGQIDEAVRRAARPTLERLQADAAQRALARAVEERVTDSIDNL